jgi:hypothetical protein
MTLNLGRIKNLPSPIFKQRFKRNLKKELRGNQLDSVASGNSENYVIVGSGNQVNFNQIGTIGRSGTFRNLIVTVGANGTGTEGFNDTYVGIATQTGGAVSDLKVIYGNAETGTKSNEQNEIHVDKGEKVSIEIYGGEGGTTISQVSWSVDFFEDEIQRNI